MILDILYVLGPPKQIQGVRMCTVYTRPERMAHPEIVIHFQELTKPSIYIPLEAITHLQVTND